MSNLTERSATTTPIPDTGASIVWDTPRGFGVRTTAKGVRAYILDFRVRGSRTQRRMTLGRVGEMKLVDARAKATELRARVNKGEDPMADLVAERNAATVAELAAEYVRDYLPSKRPSGRQRDVAMIEQDILPQLGRMKITAVTSADVQKLHRRITARSAPIRANRVLSCLSKMFSLAKGWGYRAGDNPCAGIKKNRENPRSRYLSPAEMERVFAALDAYTTNEDRLPAARNVGHVFAFLLLTGCRSGEATSARWRHIDLAAGSWHKPHQLTKQAQEHLVPLSSAALDLLRQIRPEDAEPDDYVFPGRRKGQPLRNLWAGWREVAAAAGVEGVRIHDLRHSFASTLVNGGASLPLIGALLGHSRVATTARYAHLALDTQRAATERVGNLIRPRSGGAKVLRIK